MGKTDLRQYGTDFNNLTDKEKLFCQEYVIDYDGKNAAIRAGYAPKCAGSTACKILKKKHIQKFLGKNQRLSAEKFEIERDEILMHLAAAATRDARSFVDENGILIENIKTLPKEVTRSIDSIKQRKWINQDGEQIVETEIKLVPKASALRMALEHKGLFAPTQIEHSVGLDWDSILASASIESDIIEAKIIETEEQ